MDFPSRYDCGAPEVCLLFPMLFIIISFRSKCAEIDNKQIGRRPDSKRDRSDDLSRTDPIHQGGDPLLIFLSHPFEISNECKKYFYLGVVGTGRRVHSEIQPVLEDASYLLDDAISILDSAYVDVTSKGTSFNLPDFGDKSLNKAEDISLSWLDVSKDIIKAAFRHDAYKVSSINRQLKAVQNSIAYQTHRNTLTDQTRRYKSKASTLHVQVKKLSEGMIKLTFSKYSTRANTARTTIQPAPVYKPH